jgi:nuclear migration protein JNM1
MSVHSPLLDRTNIQTPLLPSLEKTDHLLSLLTQPRHLDAISRRVKLLLVDLDRAASARRTLPGQTPNLSSSPEKQPTSLSLSALEYNQLQTLFNILPRIDPLLPILDPLLTRLKSLQTLHAESGEVAEGLRKLQSTQKGHDEEGKELREVVDNVQKGIGEAVGGIEKNWKSLETRLEALDKRIKDLA